MKVRSALAILAACVAVAGTGAARAQAFTPGLYTNIGYSGAYADFAKIPHISAPTYLDGVEADIGWRFNNFYSVEGSYSFFTSGNSPSASSLNPTLQTGSIDALGYLPLGRYSPWALYGDVGATMYFLSSNYGGENRFGGRGGGGLQYQFDENLGLRLSGRYEWSGISEMKSAAVFTVGLVWQR